TECCDARWCGDRHGQLCHPDLSPHGLSILVRRAFVAKSSGLPADSGPPIAVRSALSEDYPSITRERPQFGRAPVAVVIVTVNGPMETLVYYPRFVYEGTVAGAGVSVEWRGDGAVTETTRLDCPRSVGDCELRQRLPKVR